ncbi:MAG: efflux RND transporter periplasmic adaptor subunit [Planctomycetaceae bacterium]
MLRDESTRDLLQTRLRLRPDLVFRPERSSGGVWYHVECPEQHRFFRIGLAEYTFVSLLDGDTTPAEAISLTAREMVQDAFSEDQAVTILVWLLENGLATVTDSGLSRAKPWAAAIEQRQQRKTLERLNPLWLKIPFGDPDRLATSLTKVFGWIHSVPAMLIALLLGVAALVTLNTAWPEFTKSARTILDPDNWLWLTLTWLVLKVVHEASHAVACKRLGGTVPETGVIFVLLAPVAYVDVTSSLRFRSKWQRIQIAAAGMYVELFLAALALLLWQRVDAELPRHLLHNVIVMASLSTLLFNANPLMKFDGYYILSDLLELPNLAPRGSESVNRVVRRVLFGTSSTGVRESPLRSRLITAYGFAALLWRVVVTIGLLITASALFQGLGLSLAIAGLLFWGGKTLLRWFRAAATLLSRSPARFARAVLVIVVVATGVGGLLSAPWPATRTAPGFVEHRDLAVIRAGSPGFVVAVHVHDGQEVQAGDVLIELQNLELETEVSDLLAAIGQSELKYHRLLKDQETADAQVESGHKASLEKRLHEKRRQFDTLTVTAPQSGRVMSRVLPSLLGTFAHEGDELLTIGDDTRKEFLASVAQSDVHDLHVAANVPLRLHGTGPLTGQVRQVTPRASHVPPHAAVTVMAGGPLSVRPISDNDATRNERDMNFEFPEPRVTVRVTFDESLSAQLTSGSTGRLTIPGTAYDSLGAGLYQTAHRWLKEQIDLAFAAQSP